MDKLQEIFAGLSKKEDRKYNKFVIIFAVIGIAAVAGLMDGYDDEDEDDEDDDTE